jgi:hypothetical protein
VSTKRVISSREEGEMTPSPWRGVGTLRDPTLLNPAPVLAIRVIEVVAVAVHRSLRGVSVSVGAWPPSSQAAVPAEEAQ